MKTFENWKGAGEAGRMTMDAWIAGGRIAAEGWSEIAGKTLECVSAQVEAGVAASEKAMACKDAAELVEVQAGEARRAMNAWIADGSVLSEMTLKTATAAFAPLARRFDATAEEWTKPAAKPAAKRAA